MESFSFKNRSLLLHIKNSSRYRWWWLARGLQNTVQPQHYLQAPNFLLEGGNQLKKQIYYKIITEEDCSHSLSLHKIFVKFLPGPEVKHNMSILSMVVPHLFPPLRPPRYPLTPPPLAQDFPRSTTSLAFSTRLPTRVADPGIILSDPDRK